MTHVRTAHIAKKSMHALLLLVVAALLASAFFFLLSHIQKYLIRTSSFIWQRGTASAYSALTPPSWHLDTTHERYPVDTLTHVAGDAIIFIEPLRDDAFISEAGRYALERGIKTQFAQNKRYTLHDFSAQKFGDQPAFYLEGTRIDGAETWNFFQRVVFFENSPHALNITATVASNAPKQRLETAHDIVNSLALSPPSQINITQEQSADTDPE